MWTRPQKLMTAIDRYDLRDQTGVYELGYFRSGRFDARYIGRAQKCLYSRLTSYTQTSRCHNYFLLLKLMQERLNVYYRIAQVGDPAYFEAQRLYKYEIGRHGGRYEWNQRYEYAALRANGMEFVGERNSRA